MPEVTSSANDEDEYGYEKVAEVVKVALQNVQDTNPQKIDIESYKPTINDKREWVLSELDLGRCFCTRLEPLEHIPCNT